MKYVNLGKTDLKVSDIGFGAWAIGGLGWGKGIDDETSIAALNKAWDLGVNFYDTCDAYGNGHSEELIGKTFKENRKEIVIATKGGTNFRVPERSKNFNRDYLMMCLDESLQRLQTDYIDIYLLHTPGMEWIDKGEMFETLSLMKKSGKVRYAGLAMWGAKEILHAFEKDTENTIEMLECPFNILNRTNIEPIRIARERDVPVFTSEPLSGGILTDKYSSATVFAKDDHRSGFWTKERFESINKEMDIIRGYIKEPFTSMAQFALAYNLNYPGIYSIIPGAKNPTQVMSNVSASGMKIDEEVMEVLKGFKGYSY